MDFLAAYALTLAIEGVALYLLLHDRYGAGLVARNAIIASSVTLPFVWFAFPALNLAWGAQTALAEGFAAVEGLDSRVSLCVPAQQPCHSVEHL